MMYAALAPEESLPQGDVLDDCPLVGLAERTGNGEPGFAPALGREGVIVLTQACDLAQAKTTKILVALVHAADRLVEQGVLKAAAVRDQVRRGLVYGWYFLPAAPAPLCLPESIIDLHDLHTIPRPVLEGLTREGNRVCWVVTPYREHLAQHFAVTYTRIGLPAPYETEP